MSWRPKPYDLPSYQRPLFDMLRDRRGKRNIAVTYAWPGSRTADPKMIEHIVWETALEVRGFGDATLTTPLRRDRKCSRRQWRRQNARRLRFDRRVRLLMKRYMQDLNRRFEQEYFDAVYSNEPLQRSGMTLLGIDRRMADEFRDRCRCTGLVCLCGKRVQT